MLSAPWPSLNWQLFDYYLDTPGSYWGAHKALEALHVFYGYDRRSVQVVNRTVRDTQPLEVAARRWRADGTAAGEDRYGVGPLARGAVTEVGGVEHPGGAQGAWFLELELLEGDAPVSRNVYWLSTVEDVLDPGNATWHYMGVSQFADFKALAEMRSARVTAEVRAERAGAELIVTLTVSNDDPSGTPAVALHPSVAAGDRLLSPVLWDDSDVTLFAGQTATLTARLAPPGGEAPLTVRLDGFNLYRPLVLGPLG
jgi:exo-1,4-beta-D-glucosaminidase